LDAARKLTFAAKTLNDTAEMGQRCRDAEGKEAEVAGLIKHLKLLKGKALPGKSVDYKPYLSAETP
jgi:hypothetical protein